MLKILTNKLKKNFEIAGLLFLILSTVLSTTYFNHKKKIEMTNETLIIKSGKVRIDFFG